MTNKAKDRTVTGNDIKTEKIKGKNQLNALNLGSWNVQGLNKVGKFKQLIAETRKYDLDVLAIQETNIKGKQHYNYDNYIWFNGGGEENRLGTGFLIKNNLKEVIVDYKVVNSRISYLRIKGKYRKISLINVHSPTEETETEKKERFYEDLDDVLSKLPKFDVKIIFGDLNAKIGREQWNVPVAGKESLHEKTNKNGQLLIDFAASRDMVVKSTMLQRREIHKITWISPDQKTRNQIDHLIVNKLHAQCIHKVRSYRGADIGSDHILLKAKVMQMIPDLTRKNKVKSKKWDVKRLQNETIRQEYAENTKAAINNCKKGVNIEEEWGILKGVINESAYQNVSKEDSNKKNEWFDEQCKKMVQERKKLRLLMMDNQTEELKEKYKRIRNETNNICRIKKREAREKDITNMMTTFREKNARNFYQKIRTEKKGYIQSTSLRDETGKLHLEEKQMVEIWARCFKKVVWDQSIDNEIQEENVVHNNENQLEAPSFDDLMEVLNKIKNNKSAGSDEIVMELIKYSDQDVLHRIHRLILEIWEKKEMPEEWYEALICPIYKKSNAQLPGNYRPISLLNTTYKVLAHLINNKLKLNIEGMIGQYQAGFKKGKSVIDHTFVINQIHEKCGKKNIQLHTIFIDFKNAYDKIRREEIFKAMKELGVSEELIKLTKMTLTSTYNRVKYKQQKSNKYESNIGLKQGDPLSTTLFNIVLEVIFRRSNIKMNKTILNSSHQALAYADDVVLLARTREELKIIFKNLENQAWTMGLQINENKTNYMILGNKLHEDQKLEIVTDKKRIYTLKLTNNVSYLGTEIESDGSHDKNITRRISAGSKSAGALNHILTDKNLTRNLKLNIYKTVIRPVVLFGSETWVLTKDNITRLEVWERKILRRIFGGVKMEGIWRRRTNAELEELFQEPSIKVMVQRNRLRWLGHMYRMKEGELAKTVFKLEPEGRNRRGRPRKTWEDCIEEDLVDFRIRDWRVLVQDRKKWKNRIQAIGQQA